MNKNEMESKLADFISELKYQEKSTATLSKYKADITKFIEFIDHNEPVTKDDTLAYKNYLFEASYLPRSINSYVVALNKFLYWLNLGELTIKKLKMQQKYSIDNVLSPTDYKRLQRYAKLLGYEELAMIMKVIVSTGIRVSELKFFTEESIKSFYIHVRNKGKDRDIILTQELARELRKYCRENKITKGYVFSLSPKQIWYRLQKIAALARINKDKAHPHSLRHLFAKEYMSTFNNPLELADHLGHSSLETTRIYSRTTNEEKRKKLENMSKKR